MAKVSSVQKNLNRQKLVSKFKAQRDALKAQIYDKSISLEERFKLILKMSKLPRNSSKVRIRNRCAETGRPRGYYSKFKLCRNAVRHLAGMGIVPGLRKASW